MTMEICYKDVPIWLKDSLFYENLNGDEMDSPLEIPADCYRATDTVYSSEDLYDVLKVMRYWGVKCIPNSVLTFCFRNNPNFWVAAVDELPGFSEGVALKTAFKDRLSFDLKTALQTKHPEFVWFWLQYNEQFAAHDSRAVIHACKYGTLDLVKTFLEKEFRWNINAAYVCAYYGRLKILQFLHANGCAWDDQILLLAVRGGHVDCLQYLHTTGCSLSAQVTMEYAVPDHDAYVKCFELIPCCLEGETPAYPVGGYLECLKYALEHGCPIDFEACTRVCKYGLLDCLQLLHEFGGMWDEITAQVAAGIGHLHCLQYLHESGCPWDSGATKTAVCGNQLECLRYLREHDCPFDSDVVNDAAQYGHYECLVYLHNCGCELTANACSLAAGAGNLDCLIYLHEHNCPWDENTVSAAYMTSQIDCLRYALDNGCPFDTSQEIAYRNLIAT